MDASDFAKPTRLREAPSRVGEHYHWLDVLRGLAAVVVLISHVSIFGLYGHEHTLATYPPTRILWAGQQAVILFFVISGFVLFLLFESLPAGQQRWPEFILIRFLRLYPPYAASIVLGLLLIIAPVLLNISAPPGAPVIANGNLAFGTLLGHFLMIGDFDKAAINPPIWSLVHEMRLSLLFPLIFFAVAHGTRWLAAALIVIWIAIVFYVMAVDYRYLPRVSIVPSILLTLHLSTMFFMGAIVAKYRRRVIDWFSGMSPFATIALLVLSLFTFMYSNGYSWPEWLPQWVRMVGDIFAAAASVCFIGLAISQQVMPFGILKFLGTISYSLYLVHQIVIMTVVLLFYGRFPAPILWIISIAASLGVAWLFYRLVEAPSIAASRIVRSNRRRHGAET